VSKYFIEHLPEDNVPFFDFAAPKDALHYIPKDTSAAAIASSGLLELHTFTNNSLYLKSASKMIDSLFNHYRANGKPEYKLPAILVNGTFYYKSNFDKAMSFGDYNFVKCIQYYL
jgi:unsaturated chondroitin disaccharide hydrolase